MLQIVLFWNANRIFKRAYGDAVGASKLIDGKPKRIPINSLTSDINLSIGNYYPLKSPLLGSTTPINCTCSPLHSELRSRVSVYDFSLRNILELHQLRKSYHRLKCLHFFCSSLFKLKFLGRKMENELVVSLILKKSIVEITFCRYFKSLHVACEEKRIMNNKR